MQKRQQNVPFITQKTGQNHKKQLAPKDLGEEYGNSDEYVDLIDGWIDIFAYNIAELAMCHYFQTHQHLVDR